MGTKLGRITIMLFIVSLGVAISYSIASSAIPASMRPISISGFTSSIPTTSMPQSGVITATEQFNTNVQALSGSLSALQSGPASTTPLMHQVLGYNNGNAQWLITCPNPPNPSDTMEYFQSAPNTGGDRCLSDQNLLTSTLTLNVQYSWSQDSPAQSSVYVTFGNIDTLNLNNYAYTGTSEQSQNSQYNISNGYDTRSYIFNNVNASNQGGLWNWVNEYATLSNAAIPFSQSKTFTGLILDQGQGYTETTGTNTFTTYSWVCTYPYSYTETSKVESLQNANAPIPLYSATQPLSFVTYNGMEIPVNTVATQTQYAFSSFPKYHDMYDGSSVSGWKRVSSSGVLYIDGTDITAPSGPTCSGHYSHNRYIGYYGYYGYVYQNTTNPQEFGLAYGSDCVPFSFVNGWTHFSLATFSATFTQSNIVPYFTYNYSMPSLISDVNNQPEYLNMSYDLYSPHNYLNPAGNLEPFNISTGSGLLAEYNGILMLFPFNVVSLSNPQPSGLDNGTNFFLSAVSTSNPSGPGSSNPPSINLPIGAYSGGKIVNASYMAESPNDYVYVINYTPQSSIGTSAGSTYLYSLRFIPLGYFNLTNYQPNSVGPIEGQYSSMPTSADYSTLYNEWNTSWKGYWADAIMQQSANLYMTDSQKLSQYSYSCFLWSCGHGAKQQGVSFQGFRPTGITTDYSGDVFAIGLNPSGTHDALYALYTNGTVVGNVISPGFVSSSEIAVTPNGKYVYIANETSGNIAIYSAPSLTEAGVISLSYSNLSYNMNISSYLAKGGPFGSTLMASSYSGLTMNDIASNHHPIGIAEYDGILYVLDNWTFGGSVGSQSAILMLRAYNGNGTEIPVHGFNYSDILPASGTETSTSYNGINVTYPPYGWPLSVNITTRTASENLIYCSTSNANSHCITPTSAEADGYPPIGPIISSYGTLGDSVGFSSDFNGELYLLTHANMSSTTYQYTGGKLGGLHKKVVTTALYTELLAFRMNIINYTKTSLGAYSPFVCYLNNTKYSGSPYCTELNGDTGNVLTGLQPPLLGIPNSFNFSESSGGPAYFGYPSLISTYFPTGLGSSDPPYEPTLSLNPAAVYQGDTANAVLTANTQVKEDELTLTISNAIWSTSQEAPGSITYTENTLGVGSYNVQGCDVTRSSCAANQILGVLPQPTIQNAVPGVPIPPVAPQSEYINSQASGYVLLPYNITYSLYQSWSPRVDSGGFNSSYPVYWTSYEVENTMNGPETIVTGSGTTSSPPTSCSKYTFSDPYTTYYAEYATLETQAQSGTLNYLIQGGGTYLKYLSGDYYVPNVSDANLIIPPTLFYTMFTNRIFGEAYANLSVDVPNGALKSPLVLNASLNGEYSTKTFVQNFVNPTQDVGFCQQFPQDCMADSAPAYQIEVYTPIQHQTGVGYSSTYYNGNSASGFLPPFNYTNSTLPDFTQLYNIYRFAEYQNTLSLNMTNSQPLGYNRIIFTYVDQFNNTITMPLDVDLAKTTLINMSVTPTVNAINPNETSIAVQGEIGTIDTILNPTQQPLAGSPIYIYYNGNLNFYNYTTPSGNAYRTWSDYCAFAPGALGCSLANYLSAVNTPIQSLETNTIDFSTQLNSSGECAAEPKSMLTLGNFIQCNIYPNNKWNLPRSGTTESGSYEYCVPVYTNGTGYLTSQFGLVGIATTNSSGMFSYTFNACGTGNDKVTASYYGWPPPEPVTVYQPPLSNATQNCAVSGVCQNYQEYNYYIAPTSTSQTVNIGLYELSFGDVGAYALAAFAACVAATLFFLHKRSSR